MALAKSRARQRKPFEPNAFLGIGNIPEDNTVLPKQERKERRTKTSVALSPLPEIGGRHSTFTQNDDSDAYANLLSHRRQKRGETTTALNTLSTDADPLNFDGFYLKRQATSTSRSESRATHISRGLAPPNTGSHAFGDPARAPSSLSSIGGTRSDIRLRIPFKQHIGNLDYVNQRTAGTTITATPLNPDTTSWDILKVAEDLIQTTPSEQDGEGSPRHAGRLRKAKLQPLKPVQIDGPSIEQCAGIIAESHYNPRTMMDPFALRSELLMSSFTPQEFQHWQDAAANLVSSSRRTSPILGAKGEDPLLVFARNYNTNEKIDHEKIQAFRQYAASHRASRSSSPGFPQPEQNASLNKTDSMGPRR